MPPNPLPWSGILGTTPADLLLADAAPSPFGLFGRMAQNGAQTPDTQAQYAKVGLGARYPIDNPGTVFDSAEAAGWDITSQMNPVSQSDNNEYHWLYVRDPATGKIGYTDPYNEGESGGPNVTLPVTFNGQSADHPVVFGMGHTHGKRSVLYPTSNEFSVGQNSDMNFMRTGGNGRGFNFFTLGTPTDGFWEWTPYNDPHLQRLTNTD